jgi:hypothetical protein
LFDPTFLWKNVTRQVEAFKWMEKNDYVMLCEPVFISFGGQ